MRRASSLVQRAPAWLDDATRALLNDTVTTLAERFSDSLLAVILFGSVARHEERPLDDRRPSDVDVLAIFDHEALPLNDRLEIFAAVGDACTRHLDAPREINVLPVTRSMSGWDASFLANVAHDAVVLYSAVPDAALPIRLLSEGERSEGYASPTSSI
jgi:predicted nucleotidyltransferase